MGNENTISTKTLVLPFITETATENEDVSYQAELACVVCMAEAQRKKPGLLRDSSEKTAYVAKVYYPLWVLSIGDACLFIDGLKSSTHAFSFEEPTRTAAFVEELKKNAIMPQKFVDALKIQVKEAREFVTPCSFSFEAVIDDKELLSYLPGYFRKGIFNNQNHQESATIPPEIDGETAVGISQAYKNCQRIIQAHIKGLRYALTQLKEKLDFQTAAAANENEIIKEKLDQETAILKPKVEMAVNKLTKKQDKVLATIERSLESKTAGLERKREKYMRKLQVVEHKRDAVQRKRDTAKKKNASKSSSGEFALKKYKREIENIKKEIKAVSDELNAAKKEGENKLRQKTEEFQNTIALEENRLTQLINAFTIKTGEKQKQTQEIISQAAALTSSLQNRIDDLKRSGNTLKSQVEVDCNLDETEEPVFALLPIYLIKYTKKDEERHSLFSPITVTKNTSVLKELKKRLSLNSEPNLQTFTRTANKKLQETLNIWVLGKIQSNAAFRMKINEICQASNLIDLNSYAQTLNEGLDEIEKKGWMTHEEAAIFCRRIMEEAL